MSSFRSDNLGFSNSLFSVLAEGGIMLFILYLVPFIVLIAKIFEQKNNQVAYWGFGIIILFITTIFQDRCIMILILSFGFSNIKMRLYTKANRSFENDNKTKIT